MKCGAVKYSVLSVLGLAVTGYLAAVAYMYVKQDALTFPAAQTDYIETTVYNRADATPLRIPSATDGVTLSGVHFKSTAPEAPLYLLYGGNQHDVVNFSRYMFDVQTKQQANVIGMYYRGYGPAGFASEGEPSQQALYADALAVFDFVRPMFGGKVTLVGYSLGTSVATYVAANRIADKVILLGPFDKITEVAKQSYGWLPVDLLMKNKFPTVEYMPKVEEPVGIIVGKEDTLIPNRLSKNLADVTPNLFAYVALPGVNHGELVTAKTAEEALLELVTRQQ